MVGPVSGHRGRLLLLLLMRREVVHCGLVLDRR